MNGEPHTVDRGLLLVYYYLLLPSTYYGTGSTGKPTAVASTGYRYWYYRLKKLQREFPNSKEFKRIKI